MHFIKSILLTFDEQIDFLDILRKVPLRDSLSLYPRCLIIGLLLGGKILYQLLKGRLLYEPGFYLGCLLQSFPVDLYWGHERGGLILHGQKCHGPQSFRWRILSFGVGSHNVLFAKVLFLSSPGSSDHRQDFFLQHRTLNFPNAFLLFEINTQFLQIFIVDAIWLSPYTDTCCFPFRIGLISQPKYFVHLIWKYL